MNEVETNVFTRDLIKAPFSLCIGWTTSGLLLENGIMSCHRVAIELLLTHLSTMNCLDQFTTCIHIGSWPWTESCNVSVTFGFPI